MIYFIQRHPVAMHEDGGGPIKIGYTANLRTRLNDLRCASPDELFVLLTLHGDKKDEKALHLEFEEHWIRGEWFRAHDDLYDYISEARYGVLEDIEDPAARLEVALGWQVPILP